MQKLSQPNCDLAMCCCWRAILAPARPRSPKRCVQHLVLATVTSPTFTLVHEYRGSKLVVCHADLYRLERTGELADLGLDDARRSGAVLVVEWGDLSGDEFTEALTLTFTHAGEAERTITVASRGTTWGPRVTRLFAALGQGAVATPQAGGES